MDIDNALEVLIEAIKCAAESIIEASDEIDEMIKEEVEAAAFAVKAHYEHIRNICANSKEIRTVTVMSRPIPP